MASNPEKLTCISSIICDDVYRDERTKKLVIVGVFNTVTAAEFPCTHPHLCLLFSLTNGKGDYDLAVRIEHERSGAEALRLSGPFRMPSPLTVADLDVRLQNVTFPEAGKYWVIVESDGDTVCQRPFFVRDLRGKQEPSDAPAS